MTQCHFMSEGWDCGRPMAERCECETRLPDASGMWDPAMSTCTCTDHIHRTTPVENIKLMDGRYEPIEDFEERLKAIT